MTFSKWRIGDLCSVRIGRTPRRDSPQFWGGSGIWVTVRELSGGVITSSKEQISDLAVREVMQAPIPVGTLLFSFKLSIGKMAIAGAPLYTNEAIAALVIRDPNQLDRDYLRFALMATSSESSANHAVLGKVLNKEKVEGIEILVPPLPEQRRIVDLLSRAEGIVRLRREAKKKAAELIPALFLDMFGDPVTNPNGWQTAKFGSLGKCRLGKMLDKKKQSGDYQRPYLRNVNVQWDRIDTHDLLTMDFQPDEQATFLVHPGDVLICEGGEIGRAAVWTNQIHECYYQKALHKLTPDKSVVRADFVVWLLWHLARKEAFGTSGHATIAHLTGVQLKGLSVIAPPVGLQVEFENQVERVHSIQMQQATANAKAKAVFDSLLSSTFSR